MRTLICASNYSGSWILYQSMNDAIKMKNILRDFYFQTEITMLLDLHYKKSSVLLELKEMADFLKEPHNVALIYVVGHGDWQKDQNGDELDGMDEVWKTHYRETILDDEIKSIFSTIHPSSYLVIISDTCSSGTILDLQFSKNENCIAISSCQDYQDSLQSGDGSVMSFCLFEILKEKPTYAEIKHKLRQRMSEFVGDLQHELVNVSNPQLWNLKCFKEM